ncbi:MAG: signal peptidase II [Polyangiales bacterium]
MSDENTEIPEAAEAPEAREAPASADETAAKAPAKPQLSAGDWAFFFALSAGTAGLDLWSKAWALNRLSRPIANPPPLCAPPPGRPGIDYLMQRQPSETLTLIRDYLDLTYAENCGGAWGLLHGARETLRRPFFLLVTVAAVAYIVHLYRTLEQGQRVMKVALPLVLGGAIGNLVDRVRLGYVVDFIHMHWRHRSHWPTYNVADIAITVGIGLMLLEYILEPRRARARKAAAAPVVETATTAS